MLVGRSVRRLKEIPTSMIPHKNDANCTDGEGSGLCSSNHLHTTTHYWIREYSNMKVHTIRVAPEARQFSADTCGAVREEVRRSWTWGFVGWTTALPCALGSEPEKVVEMVVVTRALACCQHQGNSHIQTHSGHAELSTTHPTNLQKPSI